MRLGIFGGTFDPVHYGHLLLAESCREQCRLDHIRLVPASVPPHKQQRQLTPGKERIEMLELAVAGHEALHVSTAEMDRGGVSFTVDTLTDIRRQAPDARLFLLMGADSLLDLPTWRQTARICELATLVVVHRCGSPPPDLETFAPFATAPRREQIRQHLVEMPLIELSSREIRRRVAAGRSIRYFTPRAVEKYIETHGLYRDSPAG